ncbi:hypothetical protein C8R46DRAFT_1046076 [Mycena filopes]|nr:hypothetical protein C8R46DRAFT_1046076 [Mycena filopes]
MAVSAIRCHKFALADTGGPRDRFGTVQTTRKISPKMGEKIGWESIRIGRQAARQPEYTIHRPHSPRRPASINPTFNFAITTRLNRGKMENQAETESQQAKVMAAPISLSRRRDPSLVAETVKYRPKTRAEVTASLCFPPLVHSWPTGNTSFFASCPAYLPEEILEESLTFYTTYAGQLELRTWLTNYLYRRPYDEDDYFDVAVVIGRHHGQTGVSLKRVARFESEENCWKVVFRDSPNGPKLLEEKTSYGPNRGEPLFCWERPYQYFEEWMRWSCPQLLSWNGDVFMEQFYYFLDGHRDPPSGIYYPGSHSQIRIGFPSGLLRGISYGGIEAAHGSDGEGHQSYLAGLNSPLELQRTAVAVAAGFRGKELWPALALDFGAWMCVRPDMWPTRPPEEPTTTAPARANNTAADSVFHIRPPEVLIQILPLLPLADVRTEILWDHAHHGDLRWILPVERVAGEVARANQAIASWSSSMRNRRRLWGVYGQLRDLWQAGGFGV